MKLPAWSVAWLLPFLLTGCFEVPFHKKHPVQDEELAPPIESLEALELVNIELPPQDTVIAAYAVHNMREETQPIRPPTRHRKLLNPDDAANPVEPAPAANPEVSAIGQLSSGDPPDFRQETESSVSAIEGRLNGIHRPLSDPEQRTAAHIREFLKQARTALASGDVEGAHTLAAKADVLLSELTK